MDIKIYCDNCGKELKSDMEIEYSNELCEYYCYPDCATTRYYDAMGSIPLDKYRFSKYNIVIKNGELYKKI